MNKIIDFLQNQFEDEDMEASSIDKEKLSNSFSNIKGVLNSQNGDERSEFQMGIIPKFKKGQIWLCKHQYYDALGNEITGEIPYMVLIVSNLEELGDNSFVRIQPITPFTEFRAEDEPLVNDATIVGFEFIVETWNEQPVLTSVMDQFLGKINIDSLDINDNELNLSKTQREFRKTEIKNTSYLRQSINSLLESNELKEDKVIFLNIANSIVYPKTDFEEDNNLRIVAEFEQNYLRAAKKGNFDVRETFFFEEKHHGIKITIKIIKERTKYILSILQPEDVVLKNINGIVLKQISTNLYDNLDGGLYLMEIEGIENLIRIRLK